MRRPPLDKVVFVLSFAVLAWFYGFFTSALGLFPNDFLIRAWIQALALSEPNGVPNSVPNDSPPGWTTSRVYDREGVRILKPGQVQAGLTLIASYWEDFGWKPGLKLIDSEGNIVHKWLIDPVEIFSNSAYRRLDEVEFDQRQIHGFHLFPNGDVLVNVDYVGTARLDACGRVLWRLTEGSHHSIARAEDGSFWIPGSTKKEPAVSSRYPDGYPGLDRPIYHEQILHISGNGKILDKINLLDLLYANGLERHIVKAGRRSAVDITHTNDVEPLGSSMAEGFPFFDSGDLLVSIRNLDLVLVFDPETGDVKWHTSYPIIEQHDPDFLRDGWIGIFDNNRDGTDRGEMLGGSRIVTVQPHTDSVRVVFPTGHSAPFYSEYMGQWQLLENGNMLLTESFPGRVVEVAPDGQSVWEWVREPYDTLSTPWVTGSERHPVRLETAASWPCSPGDPAGSQRELES
jgi:hypothetical protein